jgi:hypothetical protein
MLLAALAPPALSDTTTTATTSTMTTTPPAVEQPQRGWTVIATSARGVEVDHRSLLVDGADFTVVRFRARTTAFRLHVGTTDPPGAARVLPGDAQPLVAAGELHIGVLAVFNAAFKATDHAGGTMLDGRVVTPLLANRATVAIDASGRLTIGVWGKDLPSKTDPAIALRQNLVLLVDHGAPTAAARTPYWGTWGGTVQANPATPRSALGIDASGNVVYVASMQRVVPLTLARALAQVATRGLELDINASWPTLGASAQPLHSRTGAFTFELPGELNTPYRYLTGSDRDFFSVLAEPGSWSCQVTAPTPTGQPAPEPVTTGGAGCTPAAP